ncbi:helix-turn-helix domain-containing protein [Dyadobacter sp. CY323]|uniref:helix-turn-helix domain-containing protein n=1 Tax=Dyadobacter sp. CY323 TaxID=2907302 RepID=UPI001F3AD258|nr:helix-turn-helix domain-containing protein [Dyadobacter sp. CY323]MCE6992073.1 helix-turn-helix domain-containing protein [Dyadobacter sp. CY323]
MNTIGSRISELMAGNKVTAYSLSKMSGLSESTLSRIIRDLSTPSITSIILIAKALSVSSKWLRTGEGPIYGDVDDEVIESDEEKNRFADRLNHLLTKKRLTLYEFSRKTGISRSTLSALLHGAELGKHSTAIKILSAFPDVNANWLFVGGNIPIFNDTRATSSRSEAIEDIERSRKFSNGKEIPSLQDTDALEIIKREDGTEFRHLGEDRYLLITPFVESYEFNEYFMQWEYLSYFDKLPKHAVVVESLNFGVHRSFECTGDAMDDGSRKAICDGDIVTGRRFEPKYWKKGLGLFKIMNFIVHSNESIFPASIAEYDVGNETIKCSFLNPHKTSYPDVTIKLDDIQEIYSIIKVDQRSI